MLLSPHKAALPSSSSSMDCPSYSASARIPGQSIKVKMKEVLFLRGNSSTTLPRVDPLLNPDHTDKLKQDMQPYRVWHIPDGAHGMKGNKAMLEYFRFH